MVASEFLAAEGEKNGVLRAEGRPVLADVAYLLVAGYHPVAAV
jgi:hypothetical protein